MPLIERIRVESPLFSVCIPQYNRTSFLLEALRSFGEQTFRGFEICISDGGSTDGRRAELLEFLIASGLSFRFKWHEENLRYDPNLRACIEMARGRYCLLFGNDDKPASAGTIALLSEQVLRHDFPEVAISNFYELTTQRAVRRIRRSGILGSGVAAAIANFRNFSFVSGILLGREAAQKYATPKWDGSEMYQMYLGCRILAAGGRLLGIDEILVLKDIQIPGEEVDSYRRKPVEPGWRIRERKLALVQFGRVAFDAIAPAVPPPEHGRLARQIFGQVLLYTYPPWLIEYRRVQSWCYALGVGLGMRPRNLMESLEVNLSTRLYVGTLYAAATLAGLLTPQAAFERLRSPLYALAKRAKLPRVES